jgi:16S rRNA C967 or C1407 C5-methylase (RsmB/RsmF family)/NOL1/NOP2/fmu family ribosome biogenesis protein
MSGATSERLPDAFTQRMRELLPADFDEFLHSFDQPRVRALRLNPAKVDRARLARLLGIPLEPVPWCPTGFRLPAGVSVGGHPAHLAGLFYLQEPSAMSVGEILAPPAGARVVDLAAAPGGKTTHLAALVGEAGLVVANEVVHGRLRSLHHSLDLWGARNVVTTRVRLSELAGGYDAAVLDAPCSGEGLFRRDPAAIREWSVAAVRGSARRQRRLLADAAALVRPGGVLVYSTCTFEVAENEQPVAELLDTSPDWELADCARTDGLDPGVPLPPAPTERTVRLWPHRSCGEGQFVARLRRVGGGEHPAATGPRPGRRAEGAEVRRAWRAFRERTLPGFDAPEDRVHVHGDRAFLLPEQPVPLPVDRLARPGVPLGRLRPGRFQPDPALATVATPADAADPVRLSADPLAAYLRGETVEQPGDDGWVLVCFEDWGLGWGRRSHGVLKNLLPGHVRRPAARRG